MDDRDPTTGRAVHPLPASATPWDWGWEVATQNSDKQVTRAGGGVLPADLRSWEAGDKLEGQPTPGAGPQGALAAPQPQTPRPTAPKLRRRRHAHEGPAAGVCTRLPGSEWSRSPFLSRVFLSQLEEREPLHAENTLYSAVSAAAAWSPTGRAPGVRGRPPFRAGPRRPSLRAPPEPRPQMPTAGLGGGADPRLGPRERATLGGCRSKCGLLLRAAPTPISLAQPRSPRGTGLAEPRGPAQVRELGC